MNKIASTKSQKYNNIMFAYIYIPQTQKYRTVPTTDIYKFNIDNYDSKTDTYKKKTDKLILPDGKKQTCQVLKLGDTEAALKMKLSEKRVRVPKLTTSIVHDNDESLLSQEKENEISNIIKRRKIDQELCKKSTKETNTSIIAAYISASKQRSLHSSADHENEASNVSNNEEDKCSSNDLLKEKQKELDECLLKLKHAENRAKHWEEQYNTLKESGNYNLTEKTGKDIVTILETISNRTIHDDIGDNAPQYENKINAFKERTTHIGNDVWIPTMIYEELMREKEFTSFIKSACYAVWGPDKLDERSVRGQRNVKEPTLTPTKKSAVSSLFCHWMRDKRHMPQTFIEEQMNRTKLNKYFNGAISAARKKINYKTIKTPNPEVTQKKNPTTEHLQNLEVSGDDKSDSEHSCSQSSEASCD
ncbi:BEN domain-containing protein 5-like [Solenopsis invicta]|uniref:BEN domain-containing protein 5-like n=1 Tax=Solenopsis invicta TaxID=13686 RepID=UPI00193E3ACF|nr:BEN domain-containing protein 5-like [Solenopsis invicta]